MQLDQVVQQNAAASEEAASSAEELQSQVALTEEVVNELTELILGKKKNQEDNTEQSFTQRSVSGEKNSNKLIEHM